MLYRQPQSFLYLIAQTVAENDPEEKHDLSESRAAIARQLADELDRRFNISGPRVTGKGVELNPDLIEDLRELGYVE